MAFEGVESVGLVFVLKTRVFRSWVVLGVPRFGELVAAPSAIFNIGLVGALRRLVRSRETVVVESWVWAPDRLWAALERCE